MGKGIIVSVAEYIGCSRHVVESMSKGVSYKMYEIPKKNGGRRRIFHPSRTTKALQYAILFNILEKRCRIHDSAMAYRRKIKSPLRLNAEKHAKFSYSIRIDFKDFFPSIRPSDLFSLPVFSKISSEEKDFLSRSLFFYFKGEYILTIGAPTSPFISNAVMYSIDEQVAAIAKSLDASSIYTRYADDIVFSTNRKNLCKKFCDEIQDLLKVTETPKLQVNDQKTVYLSRKNKRMVTGLILCPNREVSIGRVKKRMIKSMIHKYKINILPKEAVPSLRGHLAYIKDVEPKFLTRLIIKYGVDVMKHFIKC